MPLIIASDACRIIDPSSSEYQSAIEEHERFLKSYHTEALSKNARFEELSNEILAPLSKIIESDDNSRGALLKLRSEDLFEPDELLGSRSDQELNDDFRIVPKELVYAKTPPYDPRGATKGVTQNSKQPYSSFNDTRNGYVGIDARSGALSGGADGFVSAFSGFAFAFGSVRTGHLISGAHIESGRFAYNVGCRGIGGYATAEGGWQMTVLQLSPLPVRLVTASSYTQWRRRVSGFETAHDLQENLRFGVATTRFAVNQNYIYSVAANLYSFSDRSAGVGAAAAQSLGQGLITALFANGY